MEETNSSQSEQNLNPPDQSVVEPKNPNNNKKIVLIALILLAVALIGFLAFTLLKNNRSTDKSVSTLEQPTKTESKKQLKISVLEPGKKVLPNGYADPTIVTIAEGYRMYVNRQSGGPSGYASFTSTDGITWNLENQMVIPGVSTGRAVMLPDGIRVYYPGPQPIKAGDPQADMLSSFSTDGINFTKDPGTRLSPKSADYYVEGPTVFQLADKTWRMYFNENSVAAGNQRDGIIWGATSSDGLTFKRDEKPTIEFGDVEQKLGKMQAPWAQVLHPFVIKNKTGGYVMFYNSHSEVFAATSEDGIKWEKLGQIGIHGADVDGYFQNDGTFRLFYGDFTPATGGLVYSAVLKFE